MWSVSFLYISHLDDENKTNIKWKHESKLAIPCFAAGSFAVYIGDHFQFGIICGPI